MLNTRSLDDAKPKVAKRALFVRAACAVRIAEALCSPNALAKGGKISNVKEAANKQGAGPKMICVIEPMVLCSENYSTQRMAC